MKAITIINWIIYGLLFFAFFIKATDDKERGFCRKASYIALTFFCLFMSVVLFKDAFSFEHLVFNMKVRLFETVFNFLILVLMYSKIKEDKIFDKIYKRNKYATNSK